MTSYKKDHYKKGIFILIKRHPWHIDICPICNNVSYSKISDKASSLGCVNKDGVLDTFKLIIENRLVYRCNECGFCMTGNSVLYYKDDIEEFITDFFKTTRKIDQKYDFFMKKVKVFTWWVRKRNGLYREEEVTWINREEGEWIPKKHKIL